jgi:hypothetical protein
VCVVTLLREILEENGRVGVVVGLFRSEGTSKKSRHEGIVSIARNRRIS